MRLRFLALLSGACAIATLAACDDDDLNLVAPFEFPGSFFVETANGRLLPALITDEGNRLRVELIAGRITLKADGSFEDVLEYRDNRGGVISTRGLSCFGAYTTSGNSITFIETGIGACNQRFNGTLDGDAMRVTVRGLELVLLRGLLDD